MRRERFQGTALVADHGRIVIARGYGYANKQARQPNRVGTQFRLNWLARQFTDVALLQLIQAKKLSATGSICQAIPSCPPSWRQVTVRSLETNQVDIPLPARPPPPSAPLADWIVAMRPNRPVKRTFGAERASGVDLIKEFLVESASTVDWWSYVQSHILRPGGMSHTEYDAAGEPGLRAVPYHRGRIAAQPQPGTTPFRSDAIRSTVVDYFAYSNALDNGRLLSLRYRRIMSQFRPYSISPNVYGAAQYGWFVTRFFARRFEGQDAHADGWNTYFARFPDDGILVLLFQNREPAWGDPAFGLFRLLLGCSERANPSAQRC